MTNAKSSVPLRHFMGIWLRYTSPGGWTEYHRLGTNEIAWFQRVIEAWWIITGRHSLDRAYKSALARSRIMYGAKEKQ